MIADLVFVRGAIWGRSGAQAVAVRDGRILAVGTDAQIGDLVGPRTRRIDLHHRGLLPAFQDAHVHPPLAGLAMLHCDLHGITGWSALQTAIATYAASHPQAEWVVGSGWELVNLDAPPTRAVLDMIVPDRPAFLMSGGEHDAWVNSRALALSGITAVTPDPPYGRIARDEDGRPTGLLHEAAVRLVEAHLPPTSQAEYEEALRLAQAHLHSLGISAWQDAWTTPEVLSGYQALARRGELTARVTAALWWERTRGEEQIEEMIASRAASSIGRLKATSVKIMQDGTTGNFTGAVLEPYLDDSGAKTANRGMSFVDPSRLNRIVPKLDALGFQVHFHAIGERAVREAMDAVEVARRTNGWTDQRHHISHVCLVHPDDIGRFAALDVTATIQPYWAVDGPEIREESRFLGRRRSSWWYPFESIRRAGGRLAGGSDWAVSTANPLVEIEVARTRVDPAVGEAATPFLPRQRLSLAAAVEAFTAGSAYVNHLDALTGSITVGKRADLAVTDRDLEHVPGGISEARVLLTMVDGAIVYQHPELEG